MSYPGSILGIRAADANVINAGEAFEVQAHCLFVNKAILQPGVTQ